MAHRRTWFPMDNLWSLVNKVILYFNAYVDAALWIRDSWLSSWMATHEQTVRSREPFILEDHFAVYSKSNVLYHVTLSADNVTITPDDNVTRRRPSNVGNVPAKIRLRDVTGCHLMKNKDETVSVAYFCIYYYPYRRKVIGKKCRQRHTVIFTVNLAGKELAANRYRATEWKTAISLLSRNPDVEASVPMPKTKRHLVFVNPCSGSCKGVQMFEQHVKPMFTEAELDYDLVVTERRNHAHDMMFDLSLEKYDGIIIVSGDGLIHEVLNGLMSRPDWDVAVQMPIGVVPLGSGNALASSITFKAGESYTTHFIQHCAFLLTKHVVSPMDLMLIESGNKKLAAFLSVTWGFVADVDIESEKYRKLGGVRFIVCTLMRVLSLRTYRGRVSFLPNKPYVAQERGKPTKPANKLKRSFTTTDDEIVVPEDERNERAKRLAKSESLPQLAFRSRALSQDAGDDLAETDIETDMNQLQDETGENNNVKRLRGAGTELPETLQCRAESSLPPLNEPVPDDWVTLEEEYIAFTAVSLSHLGKDFFSHPDISWNDGLITLCIVRSGVAKAQLLSLVTAMGDGSHITSPNIEFIQCYAFRLEPLTESGCMAVDGEVIERGPIQAQIMPGCARLMVAADT